MTGLMREQEEEGRRMLEEEAASFSKNEDDIGCMEDLEMDIELSDSTPVQRNYYLLFFLIFILRYVTMLQVQTLMTLLLQLQQFTTLHLDCLRLQYCA